MSFKFFCHFVYNLRFDTCAYCCLCCIVLGPLARRDS